MFLHCILRFHDRLASSGPDPLVNYIVLRYNENVTDFQALAEFRYHIRRFLHFSDEAARLRDIEPQHHQLLLAAKGFPGMPGEGPTIGYLAERLQLRHHSAVELIDRMVRTASSSACQANTIAGR